MTQPTPMTASAGLGELDADLQRMIPLTTDNPLTMMRLLQWQEAIHVALAHITAQDGRIAHLEHLRKETV